MSETALPKASVWGFFTREGRINNAWARALAQPDPVRRVEGLRGVQRNLRQNAQALSHLWLPFLATYLDESTLSLLTSADLSALEDMGEGVPETAGFVSADVWRQVVAAYDARGEERPARALLARIYQARSTSPEVRALCVHTLAGRAARSDAELDIYLDYLGRGADTPNEPTLADLLARTCAVDFDTDTPQLKRAGELAQRLLAQRIEVPGAESAMGIYLLRHKNQPAQAVPLFERALKANRKNRLALLGLMSARIQCGDFGQAPEALKLAEEISDPVIDGLAKLSAALVWLDSRDTPGPPPAQAREIESLNLDRYVGYSVQMAIGRLYLLEGDAQRAVASLSALAEQSSVQPRWHYYAAWAEALGANPERAARRLGNVGKWQGRWTLALLHLDVDPERAGRDDSVLGEVDQSYRSVVQARLALARLAPIPQAINWQPGKGCIEEDIEALRTALGLAVQARDGQRVKALLAVPLFSRLPLADQLTWRGLEALLVGDIAQARARLEEASYRLGYRRAALVLGVHYLEHQQFSDAEPLLERALAGRADVKAELLRAYLTDRLGKSQAAHERIDKLAAQGHPRAFYALGNLYLARSEAARRSGQQDRTLVYRDQAVRAFQSAMKSAEVRLPVDAEILRWVAEFLVRPQEALKACADVWPAIERLPAARRQPWLVWHSFVGQLWSEGTTRLMQAAGEGLSLLPRAEQIDDAALCAVAQMAARACCTRGMEVQPAELLRLLAHLAERSESPEARRWHQLGVCAVLRRQYRDADTTKRERAWKQVVQQVRTDPGNSYLGLLLAQINLLRHRPQEAVDALREIQPADDLGQRWITCLIDLLQERVPPSDSLPLPPTGAAPALVQAGRWLRAACTFAAGASQAGFQAVLEALRQGDQDAGVIDTSRFLVPLCAQAGRSSAVPQQLIAALSSQRVTPLDPAQSLVAARCAAAIGESVLACKLWRSALAASPSRPDSESLEFATYLAHLAVLARVQGDPAEAARKLRQAAEVAR